MASARRNWLLLLHHLCFFAITAAGFFQRSFFVLKVGAGCHVPVPLCSASVRVGQS